MPTAKINNTNSKTLVILESPAKEKKINGFLGPDYIVKASYGHIRDLHAKQLSIDIDNDFAPIYHNNFDKENVISELKRLYKKCDNILLASDYDREGESIAWHVAEILKVPLEKRKRLLFTEITEKALVKAVKDPKEIDINMFYAQQTRRIVDRLIGWKVSPLLWKNIQNTMKKKVSLSAGRVQSVVNKLIIEREEEIKKFSTSNFFKTNGLFDFKKHTLNFELDTRLVSKEIVEEFLEECANHDFIVTNIKKTTSKKSSSAPFITSSLQQEASNKFKYSPKQTMKIAQKLYENGYITYMRTDSFKLSDFVMDDIEKHVVEEYGTKYYNKLEYSSKSKNSQEAHEAIRPCTIKIKDLSSENDPNFDTCDIKLYNLIWRRTVASQMSDAKLENLALYSKINTYNFICKHQKVVFDGFLIVYKPFTSEDSEEEQNDSQNCNSNDISKINIKKGDSLIINQVNCIEKFTKPPHGRFTEASLVKRLEELGIGRPSTYSSMVSTIQDRNYVVKKDIEGIDKDYLTLKLKDFTIEESTDKVKINSEKQKLVPTDIGGIVHDFLDLHFETIINYSFTSNLEIELDKIAQGQISWVSVVKDIYNCFNPIIENLNSSDTLAKDSYKKVLGIDPKTKFEVLTYIGKYGPLVQLKNCEDMSNSKFAPLGSIKIEEITLRKALELLKYPYKLCSIDSKPVNVCKGKYGLYLKYNTKNISIGEIKEEELTKESVREILNRKKTIYSSKVIKLTKDLEVKEGKFGAYIVYNGKNYAVKYSKVFKSLNKTFDKLTKEDCMKIIDEKKN